MLKSKEHVRVCLHYECKLSDSAVEATRKMCHAIGPGTIELTIQHTDRLIAFATGLNRCRTTLSQVDQIPLI